NYINLRATLMHEIGHSLGLDHVDSNNAALLMEQAFQSTFDGPQFDEIRGVQYLYGDRLEKGDLGNNNTITRATDLGEILDGSTRLVGADGTTGVRVEPAENDFVSISNSSDADYFSFTVDQSSLADIVLTPVGPTYNERIPPLSPRPTVTVSQNDLFLELYSLNSGIPTLLSSADLTVAGEAESILDFELPAAGTYYVRSGGKSNAVQLYTLSIGVESLVTEPVSLGDFNDDGIVDASDYSVWRDNLGAADEAGILGRGDGLNGVDEGDFAVWQSHFGTVYPPGVLGSGAVPEPILAANLAAGALIAGCLWTRRPR
ncbi:MAG: matrixin family metalloprotease, partial [Pirellulales bacterium]